MCIISDHNYSIGVFIACVEGGGGVMSSKMLKSKQQKLLLFDIFVI